MSLPRFSVNQSLMVNLISFFIIGSGAVILMFFTNREMFPNVSFDIVTVNTIFPGATPTDVEKLITVPIEQELKQVDGVKEISSTSSQGRSYIGIELDPDEKDKRQVVNDIQDAVDRVKDLPNDAEDPLVMELDSDQYSIIEVSLSGDVSENVLRGHADTLEDMLEEIDGVGKVNLSGYRDREIQVLVDPEKMRDNYVSIDEIERALASRNVSIPAGELNTETIEYSIRTTGEFLTAEEISNVIIRANDSGNWLRIRDVAEVKDTFKDEDIINKTLGTRSINLVVLKKASGDAIKIVDNIKQICKLYLEDNNDGLKISYVNDYSFFVRRRLGVLTNNGTWGTIFVIIMLFMFLKFRVAVVTFIGLPVAFAATILAMHTMGVTVNLVSMFGLIIVLGMLVDDGIIVAENVYRHIEEGQEPRLAAVKGAEEVMGAVTVAVCTTIAAFSPLLFMTGIIGKFVRNIPTVVIIALIASLGEALIILPSHLADFVKRGVKSSKKKGRKDNVIKRIIKVLTWPFRIIFNSNWFRHVVKFYTKVVTSAVALRYIIIFAIMPILLYVTLSVLALGFQGKGPLKLILFPSAGVEFFFIRGEAPIGTPLETTEKLIKPIEDIVEQIPEYELDTYVTAVGQIQEDRHDPFSGEGSHLAQVTVYLTPEQDRERKVDDIIKELRKKTRDIRGFEDLRFDKPETGPPVGKPVEIRIRGEHFKVLDDISLKFMDYIRSLKGTSDVTWDHKPGKQEIRVNVDREKAAMAGVTIQQVAKTVRAVFEGGIATEIKPVKAEEETDVTVRYVRERAEKMDVFNDILVYNSYGNLIPLKKIATIEKVPGTTNISHLDGKRVVTVSANIDTDKTTAIEVNNAIADKFRDIPRDYPGYTVKYGGEQEESIRSIMSLGRAAVFAFVFIYFMLASFFKSLIHPFLVIIAIPLGLMGVVAGFIYHGVPLSFMAVFGLVGLAGIVVNDSIVLVSFINNLRISGTEKRESIIKAGQIRLRPVILTTVTTVGGLASVAYGWGGERDPFLVPMALAICWGLAFASALTLFIIPCCFAILDDIAWLIKKLFGRDVTKIRTEVIENGE